MEYTVANVKEENRWEEGVYQIEVTDPVVGGVDGISNKQAIQLANRTSYLKAQVESLLSKLNAAQSALDTKIPVSEKNAANGVASLDENKKLLTANMPTYVVSVAGKSGAVNLSKSDVALGNVDNTSDATKPISTAMQNALNEKLDKNEKATDSDKLDGLGSGAFHKIDSPNAAKIHKSDSLTADLNLSDNFILSPTANGVLTLNNPKVGQSGVIVINSASSITGYSSNIKFRTTPSGLGSTEVFAYFVASASDIRMGRV